MVKILYFDTNAVVKYFCDEPGSDVVRWIVNNRVIESISISTGKQTVAEFPKVIQKIARRGQISQEKAQAIIKKAQLYFQQVFHVRDDKPGPGFNAGEDVEQENLLEKYNLVHGKDDWDALHLMCVINYLRCFGGGSSPRVVTSDKNFKKVIQGEGYQVIDPQDIAICELGNLLRGDGVS